MIVITAPTSQIGSRLVSSLLAADAPLRLIVRDAARLPAPFATAPRSSKGRTATVP